MIQKKIKMIKMLKMLFFLSFKGLLNYLAITKASFKLLTILFI
jgi:hypothetical protein